MVCLCVLTVLQASCVQQQNPASDESARVVEDPMRPDTSIKAQTSHEVIETVAERGPPSIEPDFDSMTKKSMTAKEVTVAVICYAPLEVKYDFSAIDHELAKYLTYRLVQHKVKVVNPDRVRAWMDENADNWDEPSEIGKALNAKYVVYLDLESFNLWEKNSHNLYRGRAEGLVSVFEIDADGEGEKIYMKEITSRFPTTAPRVSTEVPYATFKQQYLSRLSEEIGRLFYEQYRNDDIPDAT